MDAHEAHLINQGKKLSYLLRHDKSSAFDEHGWREVSDLVANHGFTMEEYNGLRNLDSSCKQKNCNFAV